MAIRRADGLVEEALTHSAIGAFFTVHREMGPGFLEHIYVLALEKELIARGHKVARQVWVPVYFRAELLSYQRIDLLIDDKLIVEVKATERLHPRAKDQLINYLRATNLEVGLLFHFGYEAKFERAVFLNSTKLRTSPDTPPGSRDPRKRGDSICTEAADAPNA